MARDRANINTGIWTDDDWRELTRDEHWLYVAMLTSPTLSYAGVADWRPGRIASNAAATTAADVERIGADLQGKRFLFIDADTEEALVRSFLRHDGLLKQPKLAVSMVNAYGAISSKKIRRVVINELQRIHAEHPDWKAFEVEKVKDLLKLEGCDMATFTPGLTPGLTPTLDRPQALPTATATTTATPPSGGGSGGRRLPEVALPASWAPNEAHAQRAREKGVDLDHEAEMFKLHAQAHDRRAKNWNAAFTMWLSKARPSLNPNGPSEADKIASWNTYRPEYDEDIA